jgi:glucoamylase
MVLRAATFYHQRSGHSTERLGGSKRLFSSTLAAMLRMAASYAIERGDQRVAQFIQEYADYLESRVERDGYDGGSRAGHSSTLHSHQSADPNNSNGAEIQIQQSWLSATGLWPVSEFPAKDVVDAGFLELVRYGIRPGVIRCLRPLRVIDTVLKVKHPTALLSTVQPRWIRTASRWRTLSRFWRG